MVRKICVVSLLFWATAVMAEPAEVMLFGVFHFKDAGADMVKVEDINVLSEENQEYLDGLTSRLAEFNPTAVLLEYNPENEAQMNERYQAYLAGEFELQANEIYQLGFRIAKKAGLQRVYSFDHREVHWNAQPMFDYAEANDPAAMQAINALYQEITEEEAQVRKTMSLAELLTRANDPDRDRINMDSYLLTNAVGASDGWPGANATSSWWERNFRMYALIQKHATPGARVIAIGGQGHTSILKVLLGIDRRLQAEDVVPYLAPELD